MQHPDSNPNHAGREVFPQNERSSHTAYRAYQTLTIAAILIVLGTLWLF